MQKKNLHYSQVNSWQKPEKKKVLPSVDLQNKIDITLTQDVLNKIRYLCNEISNVEWSGIPVYATEGTISDSNNFKITVIDIYPMSKDSSGFTSFEFSTDFFDWLMDKNYINNKYGLIHSHHSMEAYFSATDMSELCENAPNHNIYLSIVVNNRGNIVAKIATVGQEVIKDHVLEITDENGDIFKSPQTEVNKKVVFIYNCNIKVPEVPVDSWFKERVGEINVAKNTTIFHHTNHNGFRNPAEGFGTWGEESMNSTQLSFNTPSFWPDKFIVEQALIEFLPGKGGLDEKLQKYKFGEKTSLSAFVSFFDKEYGQTDKEEEKVMIYNLSDILSPYEFKNLDKFKDSIDEYIIQLEI